MLLSLFFILAFCFSFSTETSAHEYTDSDGNVYTHSEDINISAADIDPTNEAQMKKFVRHLAKHTDLINKQDKLDETKLEKSREIVIFGRRTSERAGEGEAPNVLNHGDVYRILTLNLIDAVGNHGLYSNLYGRKYDSSRDPLKTLLGDNVPEFSDTVDPLCIRYGEENRVACAVRQRVPAGPVTTIAGFHHAEDDPVVLDADCSDFIPPVTAEEVENETDLDRKRELLKQYVKGIIKITNKIFVDTAAEVPLTSLVAESAARFFVKAPCFRSPDLRHGSIYSFIMDPTRGIAFMNPNDHTLNGLSVSLNDPGPVPYDDQGNIEPNVLVAFQRVLTNTPPPDSPDLNSIKHGDSGFVTYHWAHPTKTELNIPDYLDRGVVPGRAIKESYIEVADLFDGSGLPPTRLTLFVFGSGFYPEDLGSMMPETPEMMPESPEMMADEGDDGCSIAATGSTTQSALLNLFLIASVLFSAVFLRKRG